MTVAREGSDTVKSLNDIMEFDHVIQVHPDGSITEPTGVYAPELNAISDEDGSHTAETDPDLHRQARAAGWELETGWTGQYGYHGPCMHPSEYIGGGLKTHIRATPGLWVAVAISEDDQDNADMWAVAYRPALDCEGRTPANHSDDLIRVERGKPYAERWCGFHASML